jgi:hypothetical protein
MNGIKTPAEKSNFHRRTVRGRTTSGKAQFLRISSYLTPDFAGAPQHKA